MRTIHLFIFYALLLSFLLLDLPSNRTAYGESQNDEYILACYYFPNYHPSDPRNVEMKGEGWSEWELIKNARPRFNGHLQPKVPLWGYTDESNPKEMARKIDAAADHAIDAFIFDWYWYNDGPFLNNALDKGFLKAANNNRLKFALMWANHDWQEIQPYHLGAPPKTLFAGAITQKTFDFIIEHCITNYFKHPSYWTIDGKPYFSIYELSILMQSFGSVENTRKALDHFREKVKSAGLPGLHLNAVVWGQPALPGETTPLPPSELIDKLGFDSVTSYVWVHHATLQEMETDYEDVQKQYFDYWSSAEKMFHVPYFPNITVGWDSSPRAHQDDPYENSGYPFTNIIVNNTPEMFEAALCATRNKLGKSDGEKIITVNSWNEWTEGSYLEPDTRTGMAYLTALKAVFGN